MKHFELCKRVSHMHFSATPQCEPFDDRTYFLTLSIHIVDHRRVFLLSFSPLTLKPFWKPFSGGFYKLLCTCHDRYIARLTFNKWDKINRPFCWGERKYGSASQKWRIQSIRSTWFLEYFHVVCHSVRKISFTGITRFESIIDTDLWGSCGVNPTLLRRYSSFMVPLWGFYEMRFNYFVDCEQSEGTGIYVHYMQM
jgi:hypothetical protein